jgi:Glyoxalase superfamily protein
MPRQLPSQPNLEHLKKQAKTLLAEMQQRDLALQLADAQHLLAREYGFPSWPRLKKHVESLAAEPSSHPLAGQWVADVARSSQHPSNPFQRASIHIDVTGDIVSFTDVVVDEAGNELRSTNEVQADGIERETANGYAVQARWLDARVLATTARKDGVVVGEGKYEVSADGRTLTVTSPEQRIVLVRA